MEFVHPSQYDSSEVLSLGIEMQMFISLQLKDFALFDKQDTKNSSLIIEKMIASYLDVSPEYLSRIGADL